MTEPAIIRPKTRGPRFRWEDEPFALTLTDTARILRVGEATVRRMVAAKQLPAIRSGRVVIVPREALRRVLEECPSYVPLKLTGGNQK